MIDTHAHLDHIENIEEALVRAYVAGVKAIVAPAIDEATSKKNFQLSQKQQKNWPKIYLAAGMHPSEADREGLNQCLAFFSSHAMHLKAVGEIGLDFWYPWVKKSDEKKNMQREVFGRQLEYAKQLNFPVIIHSRGAWEECFEIVSDLNISKAVFHWYSGPTDILKRILDKGFFVSATPSLAYSVQAQEAIEQAPLEQLLLETDSPVLFRRYDEKKEWQEFKAEPKDVFLTLQYVADIKKQDKEKIVQITQKNAQTFFDLDKE